MLLSLEIKDLAIIEDLYVDFKDKMTVLTGETGAGKSLIIDAITLLLGGRADSDLVRYGKDFSKVIGVFNDINGNESLFEKNNIEKDKYITIERYIYINKKVNIIKINGQVVSLNVLKELALMLADCHLQHDNSKLLDSNNYIDYIDPKNNTIFDKLLNKYSISFFNYKSSLEKYKNIIKSKNDALEKLEYYKFYHEEIQKLNLEENIDTILNEKINRLNNYDKIFSNLKECYNILSSDSLLNSIYNCASSFSNISSYVTKYSNISEKLYEIYYYLDDIKSDVSNDINSLDYNEDELNSYISRLNQINKIKEKFNKNLKELIEYDKYLEEEISIATNYDALLEEKENDVKANFELLKVDSINLTDYRRKRATILEKLLIKECMNLGLNNISFKIQFNDIKYDNPFNIERFKEIGVDEINFLLSLNKGEPLKPLYKIASGGEMARLLLAFKAVFIKEKAPSLMVFDEIDTGVSGAICEAIAKKIKELSLYTQVLCITHQPQVASIADYHKHIYKEVVNDRTFTKIIDLDYNSRIKEIATMISGSVISIEALEQAKSLLNNK